ncbi:MAG: hypothetical protein ACLT3W_04115 [Bifidobacterium pseudocatenulatum]
MLRPCVTSREKFDHTRPENLRVPVEAMKTAFADELGSGSACRHRRILCAAPAPCPASQVPG